MKRISVIISAYKAKDLIADTINSIITQKLPANYALELIVGVDGCQQTWEIVSQIRHPAVKCVKMAYNYGPYITFNTLMKFASGDLIARFDADDLMLPGYLFVQIYILDSFDNIGITRTWSIYTDLNNNPVSVKLPSGAYIPIDGKHRAASNGQITMKRKVWDGLGGYKPWRCSADTDFIERAIVSDIVIYEVKDFLYIRRIHDQSLTRSKETGHGTYIRKIYRAAMKQDIEKHIAERKFYINPTLGYIETII